MTTIVTSQQILPPWTNLIFFFIINNLCSLHILTFQIMGLSWFCYKFCRRC